MNWWKRILTPPLIVIAALLMWCEEWLWEHLENLTSFVARFPLIRWYEAWIMRLPPYPTVIVFFLPGTLLIPVKLLAVYWLTQGHWLLSACVIAAAKVLGTAIAARSFVICRPKLMTIGWFRVAYDWLIATKNSLYAAIRAMPLYQALRNRLLEIKALARKILIRIRGRHSLWRRWQAIRRLKRRKKAISNVPRGP